MRLPKIAQKLSRYAVRYLTGSFVMLLFPVLLFAQKKTVTGTVSDNSGTPLPGVSVGVKNEKTGASTDAQGKFSLSVSPGATLVFTYIGFEKITMFV